MKMKSFARMTRLVIFVLLVEAGTAVSSSFLPDIFTAWYWQSCKHLSLVHIKASVTNIILQHLSLINGSISMAAKSGEDGTVQLQRQVMCGVRHRLDNYPDWT
jgi:hypothetical protein